MALEAGPELDAKIASKVMLFDYVDNRFNKWAMSDGDGIWQDIPKYSTDILYAWDIVEIMSSRNYQMTLKLESGLWKCEFDGKWRSSINAPHAISLAALATMQDL